MTGSPYLIGIGGGTGSGKTTIATEIAESVDAAVTLLSLDNYYHDQSDLSFEERRETNYDHPDAFDWDRLVADLQAIARGETVAVPQYDFERHTRDDTERRLDPEPIVVLEGIFALYDDQILAELDLAVYVQTDADVRVLRRLQRDLEQRGRTVDGVIEQYLSTVKPMHEQFVEPTKRNADVIIPEGSNPTAVDLLGEKARAAIDARAAGSDQGEE